jgi:hypothetical protein
MTEKPFFSGSATRFYEANFGLACFAYRIGMIDQENLAVV